MNTGTVKWFSPSKGFGFIAPDGGGNDIFAHGSEVELHDGTNVLRDNQRVSYEIGHSPRGEHATHIRLIGEEIAQRQSDETDAEAGDTEPRHAQGARS
ncbi:cold-shock protein [Bordetella hinzii]|uniref:Probable cold shock protein A n=1 Tax=Bordetella pseudohinzii TaxID=1331258 RepID=A0A0M7CP78_9BORD|nr:hypothetical protein BBN53_07615 [Bordetella pseudohinzii]QII85848.1 cold-shock protein [Bordetella hinzii]CUI42246.1 Probable cold shock protein A [Bordetella pseudohinzii]